MEADDDKIDDAVLALLWLTLHDERRAWKGMNWAALDRLYEKGSSTTRPRAPNRPCSPTKA